MRRSLSNSYKFRQASDFWYLTGVSEPESAVTLGMSFVVQVLR